MKFNINKIILWLKNGKIRELVFEPNKVNVITGDSNTGKTAILEIIDYCFFASKSKISESVINENVLWYGIIFSINTKEYTIARKCLTKGRVSKEYYFSSIGEMPTEIISNSNESTIKAVLETEFSIDSTVSIPYGSNLIKAGSKISLRYFLLFNTISGNIIENDTGVYFDKQNEPRYRDALPRIFDLALGIETITNVLKKEKKEDLEKKLNRLKLKSNVISNKSGEFNIEKESIVKRAKEYALIDSNLNLESSLMELENISIDKYFKVTNNNEREKLEHDLFLKERKIKNLKRFTSEYSMYKRNLLNIEDSLKPISFLIDKDNDIIKTSIFDLMFNTFSSELIEIRNACKTKTAIDNQVNDIVKALEKDFIKLKNKLSIQPEVNRSFENDKSKHFFLGEIKAKMALYSNPTTSLVETTEQDIKELEEKIASIEIEDTSEKKDLTIKLIEEIISDYIKETSTALENYALYKPVFIYKDKTLLLRKPKTSFIENVGSSSNHMFLHLYFTLAMQEIAFLSKSPFVAPYIIIDQPSRPYYGDAEKHKDNLDHSDESKITEAFKLLNNFIDTRINNKGKFQMIVFEHVPKKIFDDLENVHLVAEFKDGNALIPLKMLEEDKPDRNTIKTNKEEKNQTNE